MTESYKISTRTINGRILTYRVNEYKILYNSIIEFRDRITGVIKQFPLANCEIEKIEDESEEKWKLGKQA